MPTGSSATAGTARRSRRSASRRVARRPAHGTSSPTPVSARASAPRCASSPRAGTRAIASAALRTPRARATRARPPCSSRRRPPRSCPAPPDRSTPSGWSPSTGPRSAALRQRLRERLGSRVDVLDRAHAADADAGDPTAADRAGLIAIFGALGGIAGAVALFVVAGTFALAIAQRRRETAVLRALGATPRQVRRLIAGEALLVSLVAARSACSPAGRWRTRSSRRSRTMASSAPRSRPRTRRSPSPPRWAWAS